jgi:hypothetical protein
MLSGEATTNTNFIVFGLTRSGLEPTIYSTRGEHANHYTKVAVRTYTDVIIVKPVLVTFQGHIKTVSQKTGGH